MRRIIQKLDARVTLGAAAVGVVVMAGLAGWGGSMVALSAADTTSAAASKAAAGAHPTVSPATPAPMPASTTTTQPTPSSPSAISNAAPSSSTPGQRPSAAPHVSTPPRGAVDAPALAPPLPHPVEPNIAFVGPWRDSGNGQWYYQVGLLGFPADTVIEISGHDTYGNVKVAPLVMTAADGSWNPFTAGFGTSFAYGGTCGAAEPATVTARSKSFSITKTAPRPLECDGGTTPDGPWARPIHPAPLPAPAPAPVLPSTSASGGP